jgi:hypothetical protein
VDADAQQVRRGPEAGRVAEQRKLGRQQRGVDSHLGHPRVDPLGERFDPVAGSRWIGVKLGLNVVSGKEGTGSDIHFDVVGTENLGQDA